MTERYCINLCVGGFLIGVAAGMLVVSLYVYAPQLMGG